MTMNVLNALSILIKYPIRRYERKGGRASELVKGYEKKVVDGKISNR